MNDEIYIDIPRCLKEIARRWYWLVLSAVIITGATFALTYDNTVTYSARATMYSSVYGSARDSVQEANNMRTYSELIYTEKVCERARVILNSTYGYSNLTASEISGMISVSTDDKSVIITISARSLDPNEAVMVANAVAKSFEIEAKSITGDSTLQVLDEAVTAYAYNYSSYKRNCIIAFLVALLIPMAIISLKEIFSGNVYHVEDASLDDEIDIIGIIPFEKNI